LREKLKLRSSCKSMEEVEVRDMNFEFLEPWQKGGKLTYTLYRVALDDDHSATRKQLLS
jgi:hypothetical protein